MASAPDVCHASDNPAHKIQGATVSAIIPYLQFKYGIYLEFILTWHNIFRIDACLKTGDEKHRKKN